ncbi:MAG: 30S ribosomal protein S6 [Thermoleophilaceae bacterium]
MAGFYDLMLLIDPNAPEDRRTAAISEAESLIGSGGTLAGSYDWGQRRMAYEIDHRPEAEYRLYQFEGDNALLDRLNQRLRILDGVLRFRIIKAKPGQPVPPPPDHQAIRRRDEREPQDTKVAARAAADAPPADAVPGDAPPADAAPAAPPADAAPAAPPADAAPDTPPADAAPDAPPADAAPDAPPVEVEPATEYAPVDE